MHKELEQIVEDMETVFLRLEADLVERRTRADNLRMLRVFERECLRAFRQ